MATAQKNAGSPATKTRARKTPAETQQDTVATMAPTTITTVPFGRLKRAPENVRRTDIAADVESLADDIGAHGLLQSLIGYAGSTKIDAQVVYIVGGGRRLQALDLLRERGTIDDAWPVPVLVRAEAEAIELSLSENLARRDMNPADEFTAFAALMAPGTLAPADLAKRFGFTERYVRQRLRLAGLAGEVLDALRDGELTLDAAMAYAKSQDHALQLKVFRQQKKSNWRPHDPVSIGQAYINEQMLTCDPVFRFVTAADYEKKGGRYEDDLFDAIRSDDAPRKVLDTGLVTTIAADRAYFQLERIKADAVAEHPTVTDVILCPGLRAAGQYGGRHPKAPDGYVLAQPDGYWNSIDPSDRWKNADKNQVLIVGIAGIESDGTLWLLKDFFVPRDRLRDVCPAQQQTGYRQKTQAEIDTENRAAGIERIAWRKGVGPFDGTPLEGRAFWPPRYSDVIEQLPRTDQFPEPGRLVTVQIYVTEAQMAPHRAAAEAAYDQQIADAEAAAKAKADRLEAEQREKSERFATFMAEIEALDEPPAVVVAAVQEGEDPKPWFRWAAGEYMDQPEGPLVEPDEAVDGLEELFDTMATITGWFATIADYEATRPEQ